LNIFHERTVEQSLLGIMLSPLLQTTSFSSTGFEVDCVGRGTSVVTSGFEVGLGFGFSSPVEGGVLGGLSQSG